MFHPASDRFRTLWARHDVGHRRAAPLTFNHRQVGDLRLDREKLAVTGTDGLMLVTYHAEPGTESAEKLALLGSVVASPASVLRRAPT